MAYIDNRAHQSYRQLTPEECQAFSDRLRAFRKKYGLTQRELGAGIGVNKWTVVKLENGYETPWPSTVNAFVKLEERYEKEIEKEFDGLEGLS